MFYLLVEILPAQHHGAILMSGGEPVARVPQLFVSLQTKTFTVPILCFLVDI